MVPFFYSFVLLSDDLFLSNLFFWLTSFFIFFFSEPLNANKNVYKNLSKYGAEEVASQICLITLCFLENIPFWEFFSSLSSSPHLLAYQRWLRAVCVFCFEKNRQRKRERRVL